MERLQKVIHCGTNKPKSGKSGFCPAEQTVLESEQLLVHLLFFLPTGPHVKMMHFQDNLVHMVSRKADLLQSTAP